MLRNLQRVENTLLCLTAQLSNSTLYGKMPLNTCIAGCGLEWEPAAGLRCRAPSSRHSAVNNTSGMPGITSHLRQAQNHSLRFSKEHWFNVSSHFRALSPKFRWLCNALHHVSYNKIKSPFESVGQNEAVGKYKSNSTSFVSSVAKPSICQGWNVQIFTRKASPEPLGDQRLWHSGQATVFQFKSRLGFSHWVCWGLKGYWIIGALKYTVLHALWHIVLHHTYLMLQLPQMRMLGGHCWNLKIRDYNFQLLKQITQC